MMGTAFRIGIPLEASLEPATGLWTALARVELSEGRALVVEDFVGLSKVEEGLMAIRVGRFERGWSGRLAVVVDVGMVMMSCVCR
jgi:hypothetical protein